MEKESKRKTDKVEDASRPRFYVQTGVVDYFRAPNSDAKSVGIEEQNDSGYARGIGRREGHQAREGRKGSSSQVGSYLGRCKLLDREFGEYPCFTCRGGRSYEACKQIRGVEK